MFYQAHPISDIRFSGPGQMSTSFSNNDDFDATAAGAGDAATTVAEHSSEWDSDVDDSSEEFEYVQGDVERRRTPSNGAADSGDSSDDNGDSKRAQPDSLGAIGEDEVWNAHADKIAVGLATKGRQRFV